MEIKLFFRMLIPIVRYTSLHSNFAQPDVVNFDDHVIVDFLRMGWCRLKKMD